MHRRSKPSLNDAAGHAARRGSVRIIGGRWKRTVLPVVDAPGLRPTPGRVRETLFNWLQHACGGDLTGCVVLDLYAGSGALGFEAASRNAATVLLIDNDTAVVEQLAQAREQLAAGDRVEVRRGDALLLGEQLRQGGRLFDLIFVDPPFAQGRLDNALPLAAALCRPSGFVYVESERPLAPTQVSESGLEIYRNASAGEVFYHLLRCNKKD